jgi:Domain of unknown function (DUF397)
MVDLSRAVWRKSTLSGTSSCIEVALTQGRVAVRDSKDRTGPMLLFSLPQWEDFVEKVRKAEVDPLRGI